MAQEFKEIAEVLLRSYRLAQTGSIDNEHIDRCLSFSYLALQRAKELSFNVTTANKLKLKSAMCMIKSVFLLLEEFIVALQEANVNMGGGSLMHVKSSTRTADGTLEPASTPSSIATVRWNDGKSAK